MFLNFRQKTEIVSFARFGAHQMQALIPDTCHSDMTCICSLSDGTELSHKLLVCVETYNGDGLSIIPAFVVVGETIVKGLFCVF